MKTPDIELYKYNLFGIGFYGYRNIYDSTEYDYFYYSDTTGEKIYEGGYDTWHYFLDKTNVKYIDNIYEYIAEHGQFTIPFNVMFVCDTDPSGNTYDLSWIDDYNPNYWYQSGNKYQATFTINAGLYNNNWSFNYPKEWKIKSLYEFHTESSGGDSGSSSSGGGDNVVLKTIDFRQADDLSSVITTESMFSGCDSMTSANFANSTFANLETADYMFQNCSSINGNITLNNNVTFANLESAYYMFYNVGFVNDTVLNKILNIVDNGTFNTYIGYIYLSFKQNHLSYLITSDSDTTIKSCDTTVTGALVIPSEITKSGFTFSPTHIDTYVFDEQEQMTSVTIPSTVIHIGSSAFQNCFSLTNVNFPNGLTYIGDDAFDSCPITSVTIPSTVTYLGEFAFFGCNNITTVNILSNSISDSDISGANIKFTKNDFSYFVLGKNLVRLTNIDNKDSKTNITINDTVTSGNTFTITEIHNAFVNCVNLQTVVIPNTVTSIQDNEFRNCGNLVSITLPYVDKDSTNYIYPFGVFFGETSYTGGVNTTQYRYNKSTGTETVKHYYIPLTLKIVNVTGSVSIKRGAFKNCNGIQTITIPNVTGIGDKSFEDCDSLTSITIPSGVTSIGESAFSGCDNLTTISIPNSVTSIGDTAFSYCAFSSITIPNNAVSLGSGAFANCENLTSITIPSGITSIGDATFAYCTNLASVTIPSTVTSIGNRVFRNCTKLTTLDLSNLTITSIGQYLFYKSGLTSFVFPSTVTSIGTYAFADTGILSLTVPNTVSTINLYAFNGIKNVVYNGSATGSPWGALKVNGYVENDILYSNTNKTELVGYLGNASSVTIPSTVTTIGNEAFKNCQTITSLTVPSSVTTIGTEAFAGCTGLTTMDLSGTGITVLNASVFNQCSNITSITLPSTVTSIDSYAFQYCYELTTLNVPNSVTTIGASAFAYCRKLTTLTIPSSMTTIGSYAFANSAITPDFSNAAVNTISSHAFESCSVSSITIPNTVTTIGEYGFANCENLTSITIPSSVTSIGASAFTNVFVESATVACNITSSANLGLVYSGVYYTLSSKNTLSVHKGHGYTTVNIPNQIVSGNTFTVTQCDLSNEESLTYITMPDTITNINFQGCTNLNSVIVPRGVTSFGSGVFNICASLQYVYIPDTVTTIEVPIFLNSNPLRIDCQATSKPSGWYNSWYDQANPNNIHWGVQNPSI